VSPARRALLLASSIFAVLLAFSSPVRAQQTSSPRRAVLLLLPRVAAEPFLEELDTPRWRRLRTGSALALVNPVVPGPDTRLSAGLTLGAGRRLEYPPGAAAPYAAPGSGSAWKVEPENVYARAAMGGAALIPLGQACRQAGLRVAYGGAADAGGRLQGAGLLGAMDSEQRIPEAAALPRAGDMVLWLRQSLRLLEAGASSPRLLILDLPEGRTTAEGLFLADALSRALDPERDLLLLTSLDPGPAPGGQWQALAPALLWGRAWAGRWATTTTTRMDGLLANVDLAPTLLAHLGLPSVPAMEGHPARPGAVGDAEGLRRLARHTSATHQAMVPGLLAWGGFAIASLGFALLALLRRWTGTRLAVGRVLLATTAAFLPATLLAVPGVLSGPLDSAAALLLRVAALTLCLAALASVIGWTASPFLAALLFTTLLLLLDLFSGGRLLALNLVSDFPYIGARFYGIGNEYMGLLLGATLVIPFWLEHLRGRNRLSAPGWAGAVALWTVSLVGVGAPQWGADFGGAVSLAIAYLTAGALALPARAVR